MKIARIAAATLLGTVVVTAAVTTAIVARAHRDTTLDQLAASRERWAQEERDGVPAAALAEVRASAATLTGTSWWSVIWLNGDASTRVAELDRRADAAFSAGMAAAQNRARTALLAVVDYAQAQQAWLSPPDLTTLPDSTAALTRAATPRDLDALASSFRSRLDALQHAVLAAQAVAAERAARAHDDAAPAALPPAVPAGVATLLAEVPGLLATAQDDALDSGPLETASAEMTAEANAGATTKPTEMRLRAALDLTRVTIAMNDRIAGDLAGLRAMVPQAVTQSVGDASSLDPHLSRLHGAFLAARTLAQLTPLATDAEALRASLTAELAAVRCNGPAGPGKAIVVSLLEQELIAYQDGCVVRATPVTTGRPQLPTPRGSFNVFYRATPFTMVSPWSPGSPFWYPTTRVSWVLEFDQGGYFLHDAAWEAPSAYGPGGENNPTAASHGCIHVPTDTMAWLYGWATLGTPVTVV